MTQFPAQRRVYESSPVAERLARQLRKDSPGGCWIFSGKSVGGSGYGMISTVRDGKRVKASAHRVAFVLANNLELTDIEGKFVCHKCDVRLCCNPEHLFLGTHQDNVDDMHRKGRGPVMGFHGEINGKAKMTAASVAEARAAAASGASVLSLANKYGVCWSSMDKLISGKTWATVPMPVDNPYRKPTE